MCLFFGQQTVVKLHLQSRWLHVTHPERGKKAGPGAAIFTSMEQKSGQRLDASELLEQGLAADAEGACHA
jgi:hypothetical protein